MGLVTSVLTGRPLGATWAPDDDRWYRRAGSIAIPQAGVTVNADSAMRLGAVYACVRLLSDMVGMLPLLVYRRRADGGKDRATDLPIYQRLHRRPNDQQTPKEFGSTGQADLLLRGNWYRVPLPDGQLIRLHPDRVTVRVLPSGRRGYRYRTLSGTTEAFTQEEVSHVMGLSLDGVTGCSVIEYAAESISSGQAQEGFAARFWAQGAEGHLAFVAPATLSDTTRKANEEALRSRASGWQNAHKILLLEGGIKSERISVSGRDSQYIESRKFSVADIARFFGVPPHMIGDVDGSTSWGTGIEQQTIGFINFALMPWLVTIEQATDRDLLVGDELFAEFLVDALLRGDMAARAATYQIATGGRAWMSPNEVRARENLNPEDGLDEVERGVQGITTTGTQQPKPPAPQRAIAPPPADGSADALARAHRLLTGLSARAARREIAAIRQGAQEHAGNPARWRAWLTTWYAQHAGYLTAELGLDVTAARRYADGHRKALFETGVSVIERWDTEAAPELQALAWGGQG